MKVIVAFPDHVAWFPEIVSGVECITLMCRNISSSDSTSNLSYFCVYRIDIATLWLWKASSFQTPLSLRSYPVCFIRYSSAGVPVVNELLFSRAGLRQHERLGGIVNRLVSCSKALYDVIAAINESENDIGCEELGKTTWVDQGYFWRIVHASLEMVRVYLIRVLASPPRWAAIRERGSGS